MSEAQTTSTKPKRRWLRFSLRTLFVVTMLLGFGLGWVGVQLQQARRHEAAVKEIERLGGQVIFDSSISANQTWEKRLFGIYAVEESVVDLVDTNATDSILAQMKGMNCVVLSLSSKITDHGLTHLKGITSLNVLDLTGTQITDAGLAHLPEVTSLFGLYLNNTQITDAGVAHLQGMTKLGDLHLRNTKITDAGLVHLKDMASLFWLDLSDTQITDAGLAHLADHRHLLRIQLSPSIVSQEGVDRLQKAIPNCQIVYTPIETTSNSAAP